MKIILVIFRAKERSGGKEVFNRGIQGSVGNVLIPGETLNPAIRRARVNRAAARDSRGNERNSSVRIV